MKTARCLGHPASLRWTETPLWIPVVVGEPAEQDPFFVVVSSPKMHAYYSTREFPRAVVDAHSHCIATAAARYRDLLKPSLTFLAFLPRCDTERHSLRTA